MATGVRQRQRKKKLNCQIDDPEIHERGRRVYNTRCYFCHGYSGDAKTAAAKLLTPLPRDFTGAPTLTAADVQAAVIAGRPGTAMKSFRGLLTDQEIAAVAAFVAAEFVRCGRMNTSYHTSANGWPDHRERYGKAFPFALGQLSPDGPLDGLSPEQQQGRRMFLQSCISCHMAAQHLGTSEQHEEYEEYAESGADADDVSPQLTGMTSMETQGQALYLQNCAYCHGANGTGRNVIGRFLEPHPPDLRSPSMKQMTDGVLLNAILDGKPASSMPAFRTVLTQDNAETIVAYIRRAFMAE